MIVDIIVATRNRHKKLERMLNSLETACIKNKLKIFIGFDNEGKDDTGFLDKFRGKYEIYTFHYETGGNLGAVYIRNDLSENHAFDSILYATDDIIFGPNSIDDAVHTLQVIHDDLDGVVGFRQTGNKKFHPAGVALIGKKFMNRFPERKIFYPGYFHFACQEVFLLACSLRRENKGSGMPRFLQSPRAWVRHDNPNINKESMDQTHRDARVKTKEDHELMKKRKEAGKVWGL